ncbi:MAG: nitronate monooxygenase, partial [Minicystis sp.]
MRTPLCDVFGIDLPLFAFSHCRDVVAAVSRAGGVGVLGALAFTPEQLELELKWIDEHVEGKPYGVDVVMPAKYEGSTQADIGKAEFEKMIPEAHRAFVKQVLERYEIPPLPAGEETEGLLGWTYAGGRGHVDVSLAHP